MSAISNEPLCLSEQFASRRSVFRRLEDFFRSRSTKVPIHHREFHLIASWLDQCATFAPADAPLFAKYREELTVKPSLFESRSFFDPRLPGLPELPKSIGPVYTLAGSPVTKARQYLELMAKPGMTLQDMAKGLATGQSLFSQALLPKYHVGSFPAATMTPGPAVSAAGSSVRHKPFLRRSELDGAKVANPIAKRALAAPASFDHHRLVQKLQADLERHQGTRPSQETQHSFAADGSLSCAPSEPSLLIPDNVPLGIVSKVPSTLIANGLSAQTFSAKGTIGTVEPDLPFSESSKQAVHEEQAAKRLESLAQADKQASLPASASGPPIPAYSSTSERGEDRALSKHERWKTIAEQRRRQFKCSYGLEMALSFTDDEIQAYEATLSPEELYRRRHGILTDNDKKLLEDHLKYLEFRREQQKMSVLDEKIARGESADVLSTKPLVPLFFAPSHAQREQGEKPKPSDRSWLARICAKMDELKEDERRRAEQAFRDAKIGTPLGLQPTPSLQDPSSAVFTGFSANHTEAPKTDAMVTPLVDTAAMPTVQPGPGVLKDVSLPPTSSFGANLPILPSGSSAVTDTRQEPIGTASLPFKTNTLSAKEPSSVNVGTAAALALPFGGDTLATPSLAFEPEKDKAVPASVLTTAPEQKEGSSKRKPDPEISEQPAKPAFHFFSSNAFASAAPKDGAANASSFSWGATAPFYKTTAAADSDGALKASFEKYATSVKSVFDVPSQASTNPPPLAPASASDPAVTAAESKPVPAASDSNAVFGSTGPLPGVEPSKEPASFSLKPSAGQAPMPAPAFTFGASAGPSPFAGASTVAPSGFTLGSAAASALPSSAPAPSLASAFEASSAPSALPSGFAFGSSATAFKAPLFGAAAAAPLASLPMFGTPSSSITFGSTVPSASSSAFGAPIASAPVGFGSSFTPAFQFGSSTAQAAPLPALQASGPSPAPFSFAASTNPSTPGAAAFQFTMGSSAPPQSGDRKFTKPVSRKKR